MVQDSNRENRATTPAKHKGRGIRFPKARPFALWKAALLASVITLVVVVTRIVAGEGIAMTVAVWLTLVLVVVYCLADAEWVLRAAAHAGSLTAMNNLGLRLRQRREDSEAEAWFGKAAEAGNMQAMNNLGLLLRKQRRFVEAERWLRRAADWGVRQSVYNLGNLLLGQGRSDEAEQYLRAAAQMGSAAALSSLGVLLQRRGLQDAAEDAYRQALTGKAIRGRELSAMSNYGLLLLKQGELAESEQWLRQAARAGNWSAMNNYGLLLMRLGRTEDAEKWLRKGARAGNAEAALNLGRLLTERGDSVEARHWLDEATKRKVTYAADSRLLVTAHSNRQTTGWLRGLFQSSRHRRTAGLGRQIEAAMSGPDRAQYQWLPRRTWGVRMWTMFKRSVPTP